MRRASHVRQDPNFLPEEQQQRRSPPAPSWVGEGLQGLQEFGSLLSGQTAGLAPHRHNCCLSLLSSPHTQKDCGSWFVGQFASNGICTFLNYAGLSFPRYDKRMYVHII